MMKKSMMMALAMALLAGSALAQISGTMDATFLTRTQTDASGNPAEGVKDTYKAEIKVANTWGFAGTILSQPTILSSLMGSEKQPGTLEYSMQLSVFNPANPSQSKAVGVLAGGVPIDKTGAYQFGNGSMRVAINAAGMASGFDSAFRGMIKGLPPKDDSWLGSASKKTMALTKTVKGRQVKLLLSKFDKMDFLGFTIASGPLKKYAEALVNGEMLYDYERSAWYFNNFSVSYAVDGRTQVDKVTGNIKWVPSPQRASNGEGYYEFDVRVNEPVQAAATDAAAVFAPADDAAAFFAIDTSIPSMTGVVKYKDSLSGETVTRSQITWELQANQLNDVQQTYLAKLLALVCVVPFNAE